MITCCRFRPVALCLALSIALVPAWADDHGTDKSKEKEKEKEKKELTIDQLPDPVRITLKKYANGRAFEEIRRKVEKGVTIYTAEIKQGKNETKMYVSADGKLLKIVNESDDR